jgi:hypothetical protein
LAEVNISLESSIHRNGYLSLCGGDIPGYVLPEEFPFSVFSSW